MSMSENFLFLYRWAVSLMCEQVAVPLWDFVHISHTISAKVWPKTRLRIFTDMISLQSLCTIYIYMRLLKPLQRLKIYKILGKCHFPVPSYFWIAGKKHNGHLYWSSSKVYMETWGQQWHRVPQMLCANTHTHTHLIKVLSLAVSQHLTVGASRWCSRSPDVKPLS